MRVSVVNGEQLASCTTVPPLSKTCGCFADPGKKEHPDARGGQCSSVGVPSLADCPVSITRATCMCAVCVPDNASEHYVYFSGNSLIYMAVV